MANWKDYQEEAAEFFRSLGLEADTDVTIQGVRTKHDVDVVVKSHHYGFDITWIVECKFWKESVSKLHVLALRAIVTDAGADRGILLSETGFQSGAVEAANLTNVQVTSLADLSVTAREQITAVQLRELYERVERCNLRYWEIPKARRIADDLRPDFSQVGYSGPAVIDACRDIFARASLGRYPFSCEALARYFMPRLEQDLQSGTQVVHVLGDLVRELEAKLAASEAKQP
jgi:restriction system protein